MIYRIHNGISSVAVDLRSLHYIDGLAVIETTAKIYDKDYIVRGLVDTSGIEIEKIRAFCSNIINLGNGTYVHTIQISHDFGPRKGEIVEESTIKKIGSGGYIYDIAKFEGKVSVAEVELEESLEEGLKKKLLNAPSNKFKGKRTIYNVRIKEEISYPFDSIDSFILDDTDMKYKAHAVVSVTDTNGEVVDTLTCTIDSKGNLANMIVQSRRFGIVTLEKEVPIADLVQIILDRVNNKELVLTPDK